MNVAYEEMRFRVGSSLFLYNIYSAAFGRCGWLCTRRTRLVIEGFPRSANTWALYLAEELIPRDEVAGHIHNVAALKTARYYGKPTIVLIRQPRDSVASLAQKGGTPWSTPTAIDLLIRKWIAFYRYAQQNVDPASVLCFEFVTNRPAEFVQTVSEKLGTAVSLDEACLLVNRATARIGAKEREKEATGSSLPREERRRERQSVMQLIEKNRELREAEALYTAMIRASFA